MKFLTLIFAALAAVLSGCAELRYAGGTGEVFHARFLGTDAEQVAATLPGGAAIGIAGMRNSAAFARPFDTVESWIQWRAMADIARQWFGSRNAETAAIHGTERTAIEQSGMNKRAEIDLLKHQSTLAAPAH